MKNDSRYSFSELLKNEHIQFSNDFFDRFKAFPHSYHKPLIEMILEHLKGFQKDQFVLTQIFAGVVYAPDPFYFLLFFKKPTHKKTLFDSIRQSHPNEWIEPIGRMKIYDEDEHNRIQRASLNLPINWRQELNKMNCN